VKKLRLSVYIVIISSMLFAGLTPAVAISPDEIIENVQERYEDIDDAVIKFSQSVRFKVSKAEQTMLGTMYFKKNNKYRIETETRTVVTDGKTSWSYNPQNNQVIIDTYKEESHSLAPDKLLLSFPEDHYATLVGEATLGKEKCQMLKLTPKDENSFTTGMKIWINDDWLIKKIEVTDINAAVTSYAISKITLNTGLDAKKFSFSIPKNADVIDLR
jgi:outer membrane lipoprotein carrier protein